MQTTDPEEAKHIRRLAILRFDETVYIVFDEPYYKVRVGDFVSSESAAVFRNLAEGKGFKDAWVVGSRIKP